LIRVLNGDIVGVDGSSEGGNTCAGFNVKDLWKGNDGEAVSNISEVGGSVSKIDIIVFEDGSGVLGEDEGGVFCNKAS